MPTRRPAALVGVNSKTAVYFFHRLREVICYPLELEADTVVGGEIEVDESVAGMSAQNIVDKLKAGDPPLWTRVRDGESNIVLHGFGLSEGQDKIVGARIAELFGR